MNALAQLETDCIYSGMMSQEAKCLVWRYDAGNSATQLVLASPNSTDFADYLAERDLIVHQCTNLDLLLGFDNPLINVKWSSGLADYTHFNIKLHDSHEYISLPKLEHNSIMSLHSGHSISMSSSDIDSSD
jgi:hypothetical protein